LRTPCEYPTAPVASSNIVTEDLVFLLEAMGLNTSINFDALLVASALPDVEFYGFTADARLPIGVSSGD
jgi:hydroxymethylglutaryl-CoA lyase